MKHATSIALHAYWQSCHDRTGVPAGGIRAAELAPILPSLFLLDLNLHAGARFRYCGTTIAARYGRSLMGETFLAPWNEGDREVLQRDLRALAIRSTGLVAGIMAETVGGGFSCFEMLVLPLAGETGMAGAIGSMAHIGGHEETNRIRARFVSQSLRSVRFLPALGQPILRADVDQAPTPLPSPSAARRQYRHLTVVGGGGR